MYLLQLFMSDKRMYPSFPNNQNLKIAQENEQEIVIKILLEYEKVKIIKKLKNYILISLLSSSG